MIINSGENGDPPTSKAGNFQSLALAKKINDKSDLDCCSNEICLQNNLRGSLSASRRSIRSAALRKLSNDRNNEKDKPEEKSPEFEAHLHYRSGVIYDGLLKNNQKTDHGVFLWPNGDLYTGHFYLNLRNGLGIQIWSDGSSYEGHFEKDKRTGVGKHKSINGEIYEGAWYLDYRHGFGKYKWNDLSIYEGTFFMNEREGYGTLKYSTGDNFTGLYKKGVRYGPGVLKYSETNEEDIGYWYGDKLIRLLCSANVTFELSSDIEQPSESEKHVEIRSWNDPDMMFVNESELNNNNMFVESRVMTSRPIRESTKKSDPYIDKVLKERENLHSEYLRAVEAMIGREKNIIKIEEANSRKVEIQNLTKVLKEIFKHFKQYDIFNRHISKKLNIDLSVFESSKREKFSSSPGVLETSSMEFLNACYEGNFEKVSLLRNMVNVDVCDNRGYSGLILAVLRCDSKIINFLLDNGANINHQLDNGLTALMICVIRYYTGEKFLPNIALKHQDLTLTRKISPNSLIAPVYLEENESKTSVANNNTNNIDGIFQSSKITEVESQKSSLIRKDSDQDDLEEKYANLMSRNDRIDSIKENDNDAGSRLLKKTKHFKLLNQLFEIIELLLRRGADPSLSCVPYPALCFAVAAGDLKIVKLLLQKGADANKRMPKKYASLTPLILACGVMNESGPKLVKMLLDSLADPNASADPGDEYMSMCDPACVTNEAMVSEELLPHLTGRTPLHVACMRNDEYAAEIVRLLLDHSANANLICNGQSPLSLAIASGNKEAIDLLLKSNLCDPNLPLTNGHGSALCAVSSTLYEHNLQPNDRIKLIDKLIYYGADMLQPVVYGARNHVGSVVDYAYYMYNADPRIAHTPYHSLTVEERETYNARKNLLAHLSKRFREKVDEREILMQKGLSIYGANRKQWGLPIRLRRNDDLTDSELFRFERGIQKFCSACGRSVGVKLTLCSRCKQVYYCSNACKQKAWDEWHKEKCELHESHRRSRSKQYKNSSLNEQSKNKQTSTTTKFNNRNSMSAAAYMKKKLNNNLNTANNKISINPDYKEPENYSYN